MFKKFHKVIQIASRCLGIYFVLIHILKNILSKYKHQAFSFMMLFRYKSCLKAKRYFFTSHDFLHVFLRIF